MRGGGVLDDGPEHDSENDKGLAFNYLTDPGLDMTRTQQHTMMEFDSADEDKKVPSGLALKHSCGSKYNTVYWVLCTGLHDRYHFKKHLGD